MNSNELNARLLWAQEINDRLALKHLYSYIQNVYVYQ